MRIVEDATYPRRQVGIEVNYLRSSRLGTIIQFPEPSLQLAGISTGNLIRF